VSLCLSQIPHGLNQVRTWTSAVRGQWLTAWGMAYHSRHVKWLLKFTNIIGISTCTEERCGDRLQTRVMILIFFLYFKCSELLRLLSLWRVDFNDDFVFICSIYSGHHSILIPPSEVEVNPALWLTAVSQYRVRDTFCSYGKCFIHSQIHCCQWNPVVITV
jgi:hypothetical protein